PAVRHLRPPPSRDGCLPIPGRARSPRFRPSPCPSSSDAPRHRAMPRGEASRGVTPATLRSRHDVALSHGDSAVTTTRRTVLTLPLLLWRRGTAAAQQKQTRLFVTNKTGTPVELFVAVRKGWQSRGRISPGGAMPVY